MSINREEEILKAYMAATHEVSHQFREHYGKVNLTFPQAMVLSILDSEGPMPISALAELTGSANSTVSGVVDRLQRMDLAKRTRSEDDHRVIYVDVTEHYRSMRKETATSVTDFFGDIIRDVPEEDITKILEGLELLARVLKKDSEE